MSTANDMTVTLVTTGKPVLIVHDNLTGNVVLPTVNKNDYANGDVLLFGMIDGSLYEIAIYADKMPTLFSYKSWVIDLNRITDTTQVGRYTR